MNIEVDKINIAKNLAANEGLSHISVWLDQQNLINKEYSQDVFKQLCEKTSKIHANIKKSEASATFGGPVRKCRACIGAGGILFCAGDHESWDVCEVCKGTGFSLIKG